MSANDYKSNTIANTSVVSNPQQQLQQQQQQISLQSTHSTHGNTFGTIRPPVTPSFHSPIFQHPIMTPNIGNLSANILNSQQSSVFNSKLAVVPNVIASVMMNSPPIISGFCNPQEITAVFVGSIDPQAPDELIIRMLRTCGSVADWKRASGSNGTMQPFGFVKFDDYESTLRAIRLMNGFQIGKKSLVVKLSEQDEKKLNKYKEEKRIYLTKIGKQPVSSQNWQKSLSGDINDKSKFGTNNDVLSQEELQYDNNINQKLHSIAGEYDEYIENPMLHQSVSQNFLQSTMAKHMQNRDSNSKNSVSSIESGHTSTNDDILKKELEDKTKNVKDVLSLKSGPLDLDEEISETLSEPETFNAAGILNCANNLNKKFASTSGKMALPDGQNLSVSATNLKISSSIKNDRQLHQLPNNQMQETSAIEEHRLYLQKLKEKAKNYNKRIKQFEARERRQQRAYIYEENAMREGNLTYQKNLKKELDFYSNYDDERMDKKHFYSRRFLYKLNEYEEEYKNDRLILSDQSKIVSDNFYPKFLEYLAFIKDPNSLKYDLEDIHIQDVENDYSDKSQNNIQNNQRFSDKGHFKSININQNKSSPDHKILHNDIFDGDNYQKGLMDTNSKENSPSQVIIQNEDLLLKKQIRHKEFIDTIGIGGVFKNIFNESQDNDFSDIVKSCENSINDNDEESDSSFSNLAETSPKFLNTFMPESLEKSNDIKSLVQNRSLPPQKLRKETSNENLHKDDYDNENENCRQEIYKIIDKIPSCSTDLYKYQIDWNVIDKTMIEDCLKPWISKKIAEYLGELEPVLLHFIIEKLHNTPIHAKSFSNSLAVVLDAEEAEKFTSNLWRLIIYTIEAKKNGIL